MPACLQGSRGDVSTKLRQLTTGGLTYDGPVPRTALLSQTTVPEHDPEGVEAEAPDLHPAGSDPAAASTGEMGSPFANSDQDPPPLPPRHSMPEPGWLQKMQRPAAQGQGSQGQGWGKVSVHGGLGTRSEAACGGVSFHHSSSTSGLTSAGRRGVGEGQLEGVFMPLHRPRVQLTQMWVLCLCFGFLV